MRLPATPEAGGGPHPAGSCRPLPHGGWPPEVRGEHDETGCQRNGGPREDQVAAALEPRIAREEGVEHEPRGGKRERRGGGGGESRRPACGGAAPRDDGGG